MSSKIIWFTGLSGSGKSTLAEKLHSFFVKKKFRVKIIDGDDVREEQRNNIFTPEEIILNNQKIIDVCNDLQKYFNYLIVAVIAPFEETRANVKNFINATSKDEIIFTKNATESINLVASTFGQQNIKKGDEILITELEHHSNYVPWHYLREFKGAIIKFAPINDDGDIIIEKFNELVTTKTKIIAITHLSNVTDTIVPVKEIIEIAKKKIFLC